MPLRGPSVQLVTRRDAGMPDQRGANFSDSFSVREVLARVEVFSGIHVCRFTLTPKARRG
jgi:hypothetical protein